jgi:hypothetical protein
MSTSIDDYTAKITSEYRGKPRLLGILTAYCKPFVDLQVTLLGLPDRYDLDNAVGAQLDAVGLWIGVTRYVKDIPFTGGTLTKLTDQAYRILLRAHIISNHWDGTTPNAYDYFAALFANTGLTVKIQDNDDMSMVVTLLGSTDPVLSGLFVAGLLFVKPMGVSVSYVLG